MTIRDLISLSASALVLTGVLVTIAAVRTYTLAVGLGVAFIAGGVGTLRAQYVRGGRRNWQ